MTNYWSVKDWLVSYKTNILHAMTDSCLRVPSAGRSGDLHSEPRAVLQEVLRFHHHYPVIVSRCDREHRGTWERKGKWGVEQGKRCEGEKKKKPSRGWITKVLRWLCITLPHPFSLLIPPFVSLSTSGVPHSAAKKKKNITRLHLTSPLFFVNVLFWMIRVLNVSKSLCCCFFISFVFCLYGC